MGNKHWVKAPQKHEKYKWNIKQIFRDPAVSLYVYWRASMSVRTGDREKWAVPSWTWNLTTRTKWFCSVHTETLLKQCFAKLLEIMGSKEDALCLKKLLLHPRCLIRWKIMKHLFVLFHPDGISAADFIVLLQQKWQMTFISLFSCKR